MIPVLSREQMRAFDAHAIASGVPSLVLMENAGRGAADVIEREMLAGNAKGRSVVVVCGSGNNGGDGYVVARHLLGRGARVIVWMVSEPSTDDARTQHAAYVGIGGRTRGGDALAGALADADVIVDAVLGTGLDRLVSEPIAGVLKLLRDDRVVALDIPSGIDTDRGIPLGTAARAGRTIAFAHLKLAHVTGFGAEACGPVHVVDIGVPPDLRPDRTADLVVTDDVKSVITRRSVATHKYTAGHVVLFAGSPGKTGAALLAARGALRGGAGAATIITWPETLPALEARLPEVMVQPISDDALLGKRAVVLGPGFGTNDAAREVTARVLARFDGPVVCDADTFTSYAGRPHDLASAKGEVILTPHSGELGRLLGIPSDAVESDRFAAAREGARRTNAVVLLKGPYTVVASPTGRVVVTGSGSPALATAGSGDVLAGLVGALACTLPPFEAAWCGAFLHGVAGSAWAKEHGDRGMLASDIADELPVVLGSLFG
jgi:ADP-dependent NAD(P)H-hydrate dehydratase / NAD(P)H-hydrate epimerase